MLRLYMRKQIVIPDIVESNTCSYQLIILGAA